eukprot:4299588-Amphidinium_carterae.1
MFLLSPGLDSLRASANIKLEEYIETVTGTTLVQIVGPLVHVGIALSVSVAQGMRQLGLSPRVLNQGNWS